MARERTRRPLSTRPGDAPSARGAALRDPPRVIMARDGSRQGQRTGRARLRGACVRCSAKAPVAATRPGGTRGARRAATEPEPGTQRGIRSPLAWRTSSPDWAMAANSADLQVNCNSNWSSREGDLLPAMQALSNSRDPSRPRPTRRQRRHIVIFQTESKRESPAGAHTCSSSRLSHKRPSGARGGRRSQRRGRFGLGVPFSTSSRATCGTPAHAKPFVRQPPSRAGA